MEKYVNEFEAVGRFIVANFVGNGSYRYIMYVQNKRIEFYANFDKPEDIKPLDYIYVRGYINGRIRTTEEREYQTQNLRATSIEVATSELDNRFEVGGSVADTFLNIYIAGMIDEIEFDGENSVRFIVRIKPAPELLSKRDRVVSLIISKNRYPEFNGSVGDFIYIYASLNISDYETEEGRRRSRQRINVEDYKMVSGESE